MFGYFARLTYHQTITNYFERKNTNNEKVSYSFLNVLLFEECFELILLKQHAYYSSIELVNVESQFVKLCSNVETNAHTTARSVIQLQNEWQAVRCVQFCITRFMQTLYGSNVWYEHSVQLV